MELNWETAVFRSVKNTSGKSGFELYPDSDGVYVYAENTNDGLLARYVGKADDLKRRQKEHREKTEPNIKLRKLVSERKERDMEIHYTKCNNDNLDDLEFTLYENYKSHGLYNDPDKIPNGAELDIEFPF